MVKGISKQVIVVKSPDPQMFEQAIFILRESALGKDGVTDEQVLQQAHQAADTYLRTKTIGGRAKSGILMRPLVSAVLGAAVIGFIWILTALV